MKGMRNKHNSINKSKKTKKNSFQKLKIDIKKMSLTKLIDNFGVKKGLKIWRKNYKDINNSEASMCQIGAALLQSQ